MKTHPLKAAQDERMQSVRFYELLGLRAVLAETVVDSARLFIATGGHYQTEQRALELAVTRLNAIETELRLLSPNLTFDRSGEPCLNPS